MKTKYIKSISSTGLHKIAYSEWGNSNNPNVLICSHGLTRNKHDFDIIANSLATDYRVLCYDFPGRGESDWLTNKMDYDYQQYTVDALMLIAVSGAEQVDWLGTSMGGIQGLILAAMKGSPIRKLILNDIGPFIPKEALAIIADYLGQQEVFDDLHQLEQYLRLHHAGMGDLSDKQWKQLAIHGHRQLDNGKVTLIYDPDITQVFKANSDKDVDLWPIWQAVHQKTLLIHGAKSPLLNNATVDQMTTTGTCADLLTIVNAGHAPALMNEQDISAVKKWLTKES